jgi:CotH kinase protein/Right handed beta helix region
MRNWRSRIWSWSWLVTLPIACFFLYWAWVTVDRFYAFGVRYNPAPVKYDLYSTGEKVYAELARTLLLSVNQSSLDDAPGADGLEVVNLFIPESNLAQLNSRLPHSGFEYVEGGIWNDGKLQKMKFKYRGDYVYHWGESKKSLRVKLNKKRLYQDLRTFNLIAPKPFETYFGNMLAKEFGLIAPASKLVEVTLNGKLLGLHAFVEQLEESTLRSNSYMPGDLYAGEIVAKDGYNASGARLFENPQLWEKIAINNHFSEESIKPLEALTALINDPDSAESQKRLSKLLDMEAWGKFSAFETLTHSFHYDDFHNWRLYYDPMSSKLYPVIWDPLAWHQNWRKKLQLDVIPSQFHRALFQNADFLEARAQAISDFYTTGGDQAFLAKVKEQLPVIKSALKRDPLLYESADAAIGELDEFVQVMEAVFSNAKKGFLDSEKSVEFSVNREEDSSLEIDYLVAGRIPVKRLYLSFSDALTDSVEARLVHYLGGEAVDADISSKVSVKGTQIIIDQTLLAQHSVIDGPLKSLRKKVLQMDSAYYELILRHINPDNKLLDIRAEFFDGSEMVVKQVSSIEKKSFTNMYGVVADAPIVKPLVWEGVVNIDGIKTIETPLIIMPGTTVLLSADASVLINNRVIAEGTKEQPIRFMPASEDSAPWGTVAITGSGADYSRFRHVEFSGGSGLKRDLFEYSAMLCIHGVQGMTIEHSSFRDSHITDDMVHANYSDLQFKHCRFENSLMDALDIDIGTVVVEDCHFINSGNDSIDLMSSDAVVLDTIVEDGGDKAVSVGEGSRLLAINDIFRRNLIAVQAKDGSSAALYNVDIVANDHALDAYNKNWRYNDGGRIYVYKSRIEENEKMLTADKKSGIRVFDTFIDDASFIGDGSTAKHARVKLAETVDSESRENAKNNLLDRHEKEVSSMDGIDSAYWQRVEPQKRGAVEIVTD